MKAYLNKKQGLLRQTYIIIMLLFFGIIGNAQNPNTIKLNIKNDEMCQGIGRAELTINDLYLSEFSISWHYDDDVTGESLEYNDNRLSIDHLHKGTVGVFVRSSSCNTLVFESYQYVYNETVEFATIEVTSRTQTCESVSAELTVFVNAGVGPFEYSWGSNHKTVYASGYYCCEVTDYLKNKCTACVDVSMEKLKCSIDPNEITGPEGYSDEKMIAATQSIPYKITFENDPEFATAPASRVEIEYPIPAEQRMASFRLGDFGFGQFVFTVPSNTSSYYQRLDVSDSLDVWVDVTAGIDIIHNKAFWIFQSIDPSTGSEPQSSQLGFLLVNDDEGRGEGYVNYYISPADGLQTGDTTSAVATIVFDDNAPISTNVWTNMFDAVAPTSTIANTTILETDSTNCIISFSSQDELNGSGVHSIELFVSINGEPYISAGSYNPDTEVNYPLMNGSYYGFITIATDNVGNVEDFKTVPDATVDYGFAPSNISLSKYYFYENEMVGSVVGELNTIDVGDVFTYQLVDGEGASDNSLFAISGNRLVTNADFNCEERLDYSVRVRSTDVSNLYVEKAFDISMVKTNQTYDLNYEGSICQGENFFGYGWNINLLDSVPGTYTFTRELQTTRGCDSIRTLTVRVHPVYSMQITDEIEYGEDYTSNGFNIENPSIGIVHDTLYLQTAHGCDSIVSLTLTVNPETLIITQSFSLFSGWNWWSTNIEQNGIDGLTMLENSLGHNGVTIKSQYDFMENYYQYYGEDFWFGSLEGITNEQGYLVDVTQDCSPSMTGVRANPSNHPITIQPNWNWIGYPVALQQSVASALAGYNASPDDLIKSHYEFATFYDGFGWFPDDLMMAPGQGYFYYSNATGNQTLTYGNGNREEALPEKIDLRQWRTNVHRFADNISIVAVVSVDSVEQRDEELELGAFVNGECRGSARLRHFGPTNRYYALLSVTGIDGEEVVFGYVNQEKGEGSMVSENRVVFMRNDRVGCLDEPYIVRFNTQVEGLEDDFADGEDVMLLYPNPVMRNQAFSLEIPREEVLEELVVVDMLGAEVRHYHGAMKCNDIKGLPVAGIYLVKAVTLNGRVYYGRLIVE